VVVVFAFVVVLFLLQRLQCSDNVDTALLPVVVEVLGVLPLAQTAILCDKNDMLVMFAVLVMCRKIVAED